MANKRGFEVPVTSDGNEVNLGPTVLLEWSFTPPNYFERPLAYARFGATVRVENGVASARVPRAPFDADPSVRQVLDDDLRRRFEGMQLLTHTPFELSKSKRTIIEADGRRHYFLEVETAVFTVTGFGVDMVVCDAAGTVRRDTRQERLERQESFAELGARVAAVDRLAKALLGFYAAAVRDAADELVHLYAIRDALADRFGGDRAAREALGVTRADWTQLGYLANKAPLLQGRHRGQNVGALRDASAAELADARRIAVKMIEAYLTYADGGRSRG